MPIPVASEPGPIWERTKRPGWVTFLNVTGGVLRRVGLRLPGLSAGSMLAEARRRCGLSDFGDPGFEEGLRVLIDAFEARDNTHTFGRIFFRENCVRYLINRLKVHDTLTRHPEILDVALPRPLIVTGLPRSGTTFLHRLMSEDPAGRPLLMWETLEPTPPPTTATYKTDPRIARARQVMRMVYRLAPRVATAHEFEAEAAEECNAFFAEEFKAGILGFMFDVPDYARWLEDQDHFASYRALRRHLQLLIWKCPGGGRWVLKAPAHIFSLDALLAAFPDACVIQTHRDPLQVMPSLCSLAAAMRGILTDKVDLRQLGEELTDALARGPRRAIAARARLDPARFFDVDYKRLIADPVGAVRSALAHFGDEMTPEYETRARRWLAENPQHKHGVHRYSLDDFGLDPATVRREFAEYYAWVPTVLPGMVFAS